MGWSRRRSRRRNAPLLLGVIGLGAITGYLDYVLLPALAVFLGLAVYAGARKR